MPTHTREDAIELARAGLILLDPTDNCYVVTRDVNAGSVVDVGGDPWTVAVPLTPGHKIARRTIEPGEIVTKLAVPIGVATVPIARFEHIHLHNLTSQYIPTHERGDVPPESE
ncbi:UxaA family hydrolase [Microbacterium sp.]|uniref:UxaA family hydrolase n=1 Tax=Microbacterium sp. TaxID=51671 RepID=UPI000925A829|nr:UxaA family hydrolase [Microbacterium sp.]MBN9179838.1 UxaA family hydrolase [Microbacterium sp.]MBN9189122.1 UxaA family hydrolase [Microbacterium sp.]MBN9194256.1 UxaA family hydrolase [Microbacterium sp.]OJU62567.1 MAG: hypothetical protein BGO04_05940 [Microbacterium sp. 70-38]